LAATSSGGDASGEDLTGPDVILVHRLLKNSITDGGGPPAYAFFTEPVLAHLPPSFSLPAHTETYESFGETKGGVHDLGPVLATMRESRRVYISAEDADVEFTFSVPVPRAVAWQYMVDPIERLRWVCRQFGKDPDEAAPNAQGRTGAGSTGHCGHNPIGVADREFVDWHPFDYFSSRTSTPWAGGFLVQRAATETFEFLSVGDGAARLVWRMRVIERGRLAMLALRAAHPFIRRFGERANAALLSLIEEDAAALGLDEQRDASDLR
jgi:uncharacterized protein YndB with AHSA1/START domain